MVLLLDCCYGGALDPGVAVRAGEKIYVDDHLRLDSLTALKVRGDAALDRRDWTTVNEVRQAESALYAELLRRHRR